MGLLGPRRVDLGDVTAPHPPPYRLVDNAETLLAVSDLVFIDPMSTGHTRAVEGGKPKDFHGFGKDVEQVTELIRLWCTREDRWMSPKYLVGESYGTVRAVAVAERLSTAALDGSQRHRADLERARLRQPGLRAPPRRRVVPELPADVHRDRALPRQGQGPAAKLRAEAEAFVGRARTGTALAAGRRLPAKERTSSCGRWPG